MTAVTIYRPKAFAMSLNKALIEVDGREAGILGNGSKLTVDLPPGSHHLVQSWKKSLLGKNIKDLCHHSIQVGSEPVFVRLVTGASFGLSEAVVQWALQDVAPAEAQTELAAIG